MAHVVWASSALKDLARLQQFLADKNPNAARRAIRAIRNGLNLLTTHPEIGRHVEDMEPEFREWLIRFGSSGYVALYRFDGNAAVVLAVRHAKEAGY